MIKLKFSSRFITSLSSTITIILVGATNFNCTQQEIIIKELPPETIYETPTVEPTKETFEPYHDFNIIKPVMLSNVKRLDVKAIKRSISKIFGNRVDGKAIDWYIDQNETKSGFDFDAFGQSLGETDDYRTVTQKNNDINVLSAKLISDMSMSICNQALEKDTSSPNFIKIISPEAPLDNLSFDQITAFIIDQKLQFTGKFLNSDHPEIIKMTSLFEELEQEHGIEQALLGLCMLNLRGEFLTVY